MHQIKSLIKELLPGGVRYRVSNAYHWIMSLAANIRYGFPSQSAQVVMVTGTNGKTTTVAAIAEVLKASGHKVGVVSTAFYGFGDTTEPNTSNRTVDDVFVLQHLLSRMRRAGCDFLVIEVTSMALVQHRLWGVPCDVAVMTNLSQDHLDYHGSMERYAAAKGRLLARQPRLIVLNRDDQWYDFYNKYPAKERKVSYGTHDNATIRITNVQLHKDGSDVTLQLDGNTTMTYHTNLPGKFNVYNTAAAASAGYFLHVEPEQISQGIAALTVVPGRMEQVDAGQRFGVFIDYAHTPDALQNLFETLRSLTKGRVFVVFGATGDRDKSKRPKMGDIAARLADRVVVTDDEPYSENPAVIRAEVLSGVAQADMHKVTEVGDRRQAIRTALTQARAGDVVVVTGMGHEQFRIIKGQRQPWNDAAVVHELLKGR